MDRALRLGDVRVVGLVRARTKAATSAPWPLGFFSFLLLLLLSARGWRGGRASRCGRAPAGICLWLFMAVFWSLLYVWDRLQPANPPSQYLCSASVALGGRFARRIFEQSPAG